MEKRYQAMRILARIYQIVGIVIGAITLLAVLAGCVGLLVGGAGLGRTYRDFGWMWPGSMGGTVAGIIGLSIGLLYGGLISLTLYAFGEGIFVLLAMEENTRATAYLLQHRREEPAAPPEEAEPS
jgi:hypothetical protein